MYRDSLPLGLHKNNRPASHQTHRARLSKDLEIDRILLQKDWLRIKAKLSLTNSLWTSKMIGEMQRISILLILYQMLMANLTSSSFLTISSLQQFQHINSNKVCLIWLTILLKDTQIQQQNLYTSFNSLHLQHTISRV